MSGKESLSPQDQIQLNAERAFNYWVTKGDIVEAESALWEGVHNLTAWSSRTPEQLNQVSQAINYLVEHKLLDETEANRLRNGILNHPNFKNPNSF